jgi:hypothetical protein
VGAAFAPSTTQRRHNEVIEWGAEELTMKKKIAVLSTVRNDAFFTPRWIDYYGAQFGLSALYIIMDGNDQEKPDATPGVNTITMPFVKNGVLSAEKLRARRTSDSAAALFHSYDIVIAVDIDEFIIIDPNLGISLADYLSREDLPVSLSALGLDVIQNTKLEAKIDPSRPMLDQRRFAQLSSRYTKPAIATRPVAWGSGQHRIKGRNFRIDPNIYLFHFGSVDVGEAQSRTQDPDRVAAGWSAHQARRNAMFEYISTATAVEGDTRFASARREQSLWRPIYAWNKPGKLWSKDVVTIPERFSGLV